MENLKIYISLIVSDIGNSVYLLQILIRDVIKHSFHCLHFNGLSNFWNNQITNFKIQLTYFNCLQKKRQQKPHILAVDITQNFLLSQKKLCITKHSLETILLLGGNSYSQLGRMNTHNFFRFYYHWHHNIWLIVFFLSSCFHSPPLSASRFRSGP